MPIKPTCAACKNFTPCQVDGSGECAVWDAQIKKGVSVQQNANFYRTQLGGDNLYSNCAFIADETETRACLHFIPLRTPAMPIKPTCAACKNFTPCQVDGSGECAVWDAQIKKGVSVQQNANFYRTQLGGDNLYSNCAFIADETRACLHFIPLPLEINHANDQTPR